MKSNLYRLFFMALMTWSGLSSATANPTAVPDTVGVNELITNFREWKDGQFLSTARVLWTDTEYQKDGVRYFTGAFFPYCNNRICLYAKRETETTGGHIVVKALQGSLSSEQDQLYLYDSSDNELERSYGVEELYLLCRDLKRETTLLADTNYWGLIDFSLLLYVMPSGVIQLHILEPEQPTVIERKFIGQLQKALNRLPKGIFGHFVTTDARIFPARYLKLHSNKRGYWRFTDYLSDRANTIHP